MLACGVNVRVWCFDSTLFLSCDVTGIDISIRDGKGHTVLETLEEIPGEKLKDIQKLITGGQVPPFLVSALPYLLLCSLYILFGDFFCADEGSFCLICDCCDEVVLCFSLEVTQDYQRNIIMQGKSQE